MDLLIIVVLIMGFVILAYLLLQRQRTPPELIEVIKMLKDSSREDRKVLLDSLQKNTQSLNARLDSAAQVISQVQKNIGEFSEIGRGIKELQEFLQSPKIRGSVGEQVLREILKQFLPKQSFNLQYTFRNGSKVDAAIRTSAGLIPIDAKFPMESFRKMLAAGNERDKKSLEKEFERAVKNHITSISQKYILTEEGTIDYALMYVPSEAVYYEIVNNPELFDFAEKKRVLPVSPTTFYAYIKAILMGFEGQKIEAKAKEILLSLKAVQKDYARVEENLRVLNRHIDNAYNMMSVVVSSFTQLGQKITSTRSLGQGRPKE